jgi:hypothetical protein
MNFGTLKALLPGHVAALHWFQDQVGHEIGWPGPLNGLFLVNKAKGIHKPQGLNYALSVRQSLQGPYDDALHWSADGAWSLSYHQEGDDPTYFTNRGLSACMADGVPVGVILQLKAKPTATYKVLGLGLVAEKHGSIFTIRQYGDAAERAQGGVSIHVSSDEFDPSNNLDARRKTIRAIAIRRGQPAFRQNLLEAYGGACGISGCTTSAVLEAAHISPYRGVHTNHATNGILLRADLHTLFDLGLLIIGPNYFIRVDETLWNSEYFQFHGKYLRLPANANAWPDSRALAIKSAKVENKTGED